MQDEDFPNAYNVSYKGNLADNTTQNPSSDQLLCDARNKIKLSTFTKDNEMFRSLKLDRFFPDKPLFENKVYNSCAVVSSGGSLHKSGIGILLLSNPRVWTKRWTFFLWLACSRQTACVNVGRSIWTEKFQKKQNQASSPFSYPCSN